jgi:hypothetical protein
MKNVNTSATELNTTVTVEETIVPPAATISANKQLSDVVSSAASAKRESFHRPKWLGPAAAGISAGITVSLALFLERRREEEEDAKLSTVAILGATAAAAVGATGLQLAAEKFSKTLGHDDYFHVTASTVAYAASAAAVLLVRPAVAKLNAQFDSVDAMIEEAVTVEEA